jgi:isopenicillin-N epimerase
VFVDEIERQGTRDPAAALSVPSAIDFQRQRDWPAVRAECHELVRLFRMGMTELTGLPPVVADDERWFAQMATMPLPACDTEALKRRLYDEHHIEIPVSGIGRTPALRVSVQGYNTRADIERLLQAVGALLPQVRTG